MSNKKLFESNLGARVRVRPLVHYARLDKYLDEEWIIERITKKWFRILNPINGVVVHIGRDALRGWDDDYSIQDGMRRGKITLKGEITLRDGRSDFEPLTEILLTEALRRTPDLRTQER